MLELVLMVLHSKVLLNYAKRSGSQIFTSFLHHYLVLEKGLEITKH